MMRYVKRHVQGWLAVLFSLVVVFTLVACQQGTSAQSAKETQGLEHLRQAKFLKASLSGRMTFDYGTSTRGWATNLRVPSVPITWLGTVFNGRVEQKVTGGNVLIVVHGTVSEDGAFVNALTYSKAIVVPGSVMSYSITLRSLPVVSVFGSNVTGSFEKKDLDVRKYVESLDYKASIGGVAVDNGEAQMATGVFDWTGQDQIPWLRVFFEKVASEAASGLTGGMGM